MFFSVIISQKDSALRCLGVNGEPDCTGSDGVKYHILSWSMYVARFLLVEVIT